MWIRLLLLIHVAVAPAGAIHTNADVAAQHASYVAYEAEARANAAPDNIVLTEPTARSLAPALRDRDAATHTSRRLQEDIKPEKKNEIFHTEDDAAAKTRAHLAKIAEMESKKRIREGRDDARDVEKEEKETSIRSNDDEAAKTKDLFHRTESKTKTKPTLTETTMPDTIKTVRWQDKSDPDSSQGGIRSMAPGRKWGMSIAFISLISLIIINVYQTRYPRGSKSEKYYDDGMCKWDYIWQFAEIPSAKFQEGGLPSHHTPLLRPDRSSRP